MEIKRFGIKLNMNIKEFGKFETMTGIGTKGGNIPCGIVFIYGPAPNQSGGIYLATKDGAKNPAAQITFQGKKNMEDIIAMLKDTAEDLEKFMEGERANE
jgi:hypothetical protein